MAWKLAEMATQLHRKFATSADRDMLLYIQSLTKGAQNERYTEK